MGYASSPRRLFHLLVVVAMIVGSGMASFGSVAHAATNYYVSPGGSDSTGNGTQANPWKTIAYAAAHVPGGSGNTLVLAAGTFTETQGIVLPVGVNVVGAGMSQTTVSAGAVSASTGRSELFQLISSTHENGSQTLSGFTINGQNKTLEAGFHVQGRDNVVIHDVAVTNTKHTAMRVIAGWSATDMTEPPFYVSGIQIYNCVLTNAAQDLSGWTSGAIMIGGTDGASIHDNAITETAGYGIKFENGGWLKGLQVYNNTISTNNTDTLWGADASLEFWNIYDDSEIYNNTMNNWISLVNRYQGTGTSVSLHDNRVVNTRDDMPNAGVELAVGNAKVYGNYFEQFRWGVGMWQEKYVSNNEIYNNVFYNRVLPADDWNSGIYMENKNVGYAYDNNRIYNNYFNRFEQAIWYKPVGNSPITNTKFQNNIVEDMEYALILTASDTNYLVDTTMTYNVMNNVPNVMRPLGATPVNLVTTNNLTGSPGLTASGAKPDPYFRPSSSASLVVDAGTNVGLPYSGSAPDIGAYEWTGTGGGGTDTQAPTAPTGLSSPAKTDTTVDLTWTASTDNVGVAGYDVYRGTTKANSSLITGTSYTVTGLAASTAYSFTVKAKDAAGNESAASSALSVTTNAATGSGSGFVKGINFNGGAVTINGNNWLAESAAGLTLGTVSRTSTSVTPNPATDSATSAMLNTAIWNSGNLSVDQSIANGSYEVYLWVIENYASNYRSFHVNLEGVQQTTSPIGTLPLAGWSRYGPYSATVSDGVLDLDLVKVTGDSHLMGMEIWSTSGGGADTQAPTAPTGLSSPAKTDTTVDLTWTASMDNVGVAGYDVYRGTTKVNSSLITGTSYTVTGLSASSAYSFTVKAKDAAGNASAASSALSVTTNAASGSGAAYEAEATGNTLAGGAWRSSCSTCSGGQSVKNIGNNDGTLQFNGISASSAGTYTIQIYYLNGDPSRTGLMSVNGGSPTTVTFPSSGGWSTVGSVTVTVNLNAGSNTIKFYHNAGSYAPDFDKLERL